VVPASNGVAVDIGGHAYGGVAEVENFGSLARMNRELIGKAEALDSLQRVLLDMDSTGIPVYGQ
jgi:hypothetical protein